MSERPNQALIPSARVCVIPDDWSPRVAARRLASRAGRAGRGPAADPRMVRCLRLASLALAIVAFGGCVGDMYNLGVGSTGPLSAEPDPFVLLGHDVPIGARLDLAAARARPTGAEFEAIVDRFVRSEAPGPTDVAMAIVARTDVAVVGVRPGPGNRSEAVLILRGRYTPADLDARFTGTGPAIAATHRGLCIHRGDERAFALLDDHLLVLGDDGMVTAAIDNYLDRARGRPGSPSVASGWDFEDAEFLAVVTPTARIRDEFRRTTPLEAIGGSFERMALRVMPSEHGERFEFRVSSTSAQAAGAFGEAARAALSEVARGPDAEATGLSGLLRALRIEVEEGEVRIAGRATHEDLASIARRWLPRM